MNPKSRVEGIFELVWGVGIRIALRITLWAGLAYFLWKARSVLTAVIIAAVLAYAMLPIVDFLCSYRVRGMKRRTQRIIATTLVFIVLLSGIVSFALAFISPLRGEMAGLVASLEGSSEQVSKIFESLKKWYMELPDDLRQLLSAQDLTKLGAEVTTWVKGAITKTINWVSHLVDVIAIPVLAFYFVLGSRTLKREFVGLVPKRRAREALAILHEISAIMKSYIIGQLLLCIIAGFVVAAGLSLAGMPYILILSLFAGVTRAIPIIGPIISGLLIVLLGMAKSTWMGLYLLIFVAVLHFIESKFIMPMLIGDRMQLHPALILIVLLIGAQFFGITGMFLAAPVAAVLRVLIRFYIVKPPKVRVWGLSGERHMAQSSTDLGPGPDTY
ncbi:MAG: AI-2E family transporter [Armatimonadetes bacterium]|nr:AI-2E family transporter [Armatimonadota bacterium]